MSGMSDESERKVYAMQPIMWLKAGPNGLENMLSRRVRIRRRFRAFVEHFARKGP